MAERSSKAPLEASIVRSILQKLNSLPGCYAVKTHGGPYGAGQPDILGCYQGQAFALEVKRPGNTPTPRQEAVLARWQAAGAVAGVVHSAKEALKLLGREQ